ncbi:hypothetical protein SCHPADRAFT_617906 [Schizopora paradoxa]|uniref:Clavaminate synthase-like protein n=1 Tax=Schizopora paradoxa TaxID=27342 RepID=A0A0H2R8H4_9AGAM|nr:hypothetical protein SCHPADRAFT_617906 [Schizopora paradoxa]
MQYAPPPGPPPDINESQQTQYAPPPYPPPQKPLIHSKSRINEPYPIDLELLAHQGWVSLPMIDSDLDLLYPTFSALFNSSAEFFTLPEEVKEKYRPQFKDKSHASEEGYSHIPGEKCLVTLRKVKMTPTEFELRERAEKAWKAGAALMHTVLLAIEDSLGMQRGTLERTVGPQMELPEQTHASLMRMFRYERPLPHEGALRTDSDTPDANNTQEVASKDAPFPDNTSAPESRIVSEAHRDLGLLTIVIGHTPGLECWSPEVGRWIACEEIPQPYDENGKPRLTATLLTGQTLSRFTNNRYSSGRHRVLVHPMTPHTSSASENDNPLIDPSYRFSLVHALRAHYPVKVSSSEFTTSVTGHYPPPLRFADVSIREIYTAITNSHWNVNIDPEIRRKQQEDAKERSRQLVEQQAQALSAHSA